MLLAILCQACLIARPVDALTPYFEGQTPEDPLTVNSPCPRGTQVRSHGELGATCGLPDDERPDDELVVEFFKDGLLASYSTSIKGVSNGVHRTWHKTGGANETTSYRAGKQHGAHTIRAWNGDMVLEENFVDGVRHGQYTAWEGREVRETGRYAHGFKTGPWEEIVDGRRVTGDYINGKREGEWQVREPALGKPSPNARTKPIPDFYVTFERDTPTRAESMTDSYQTLVGLVDAGWIALGVVGHYKKDNRVKIASGIGLLASAPMIHHLMQPERDRTKVVQASFLARPASVAGILLLYTIGKLIAGTDCSSDSFAESGDEYSCKNNFNKDYNWTGVAIASAASIVGYDILHAIRRKAAPLERAWPQVTPMAVAKGGGVSLSGRF